MSFNPKGPYSDPHALERLKLLRKIGRQQALSKLPPDIYPIALTLGQFRHYASYGQYFLFSEWKNWCIHQGSIIGKFSLKYFRMAYSIFKK